MISQKKSIRTFLPCGADLAERKSALCLTVGLLCVSLFVLIFAQLKISFVYLLLFLVYLAFYLLLPGYLLARKLRAKGGAWLYALSLLCGMFMLVAVYLGCSLINAFFPLYIIGPLLSCISVFLFLKDRKTGVLANILPTDPVLYVLIAFFTLISFAIRAYTSISPELTGSTNIFKDVLFIAENSAALTDGLFAQRIDLPGFTYRYHIVSNILQACGIRITGIPAVELFTQFWSLLYVPFSVCTLFSLGNVFLRSKKYALRFIPLTLCTAFFSFGIFHLFNLNALRTNLDTVLPNLWVYLLIFPNGIDIAVPAIVLSGVLAVQIYRGECSPVWGTLVFTLSVFLMTGAKFPFGLCVLGALCGTVLLSLLQGKKPRDLIPVFRLLICCFVGVALAYVIFLYNPSSSSESSLDFNFLYNSGSTVRASTLFTHATAFIERIRDYALGERGQVILCALLLPLSIFCLLPYTMPGFLIWVGKQLRHFKKISLEHMFLCGVAICGLLAAYLLVFSGVSQFYFAFAALPFLQLLGYGWITDGFPKMKRVWKVMLIFMLILGTFFPVEDLSSRLDRIRATDARIDAYLSGQYTTPEPDSYSMTRYEYEAMVWLRGNTPKDAVLAVDRHDLSDASSDILPEDNSLACYFYYGAYSERHLFLGGYSYRSDTESMREWLRNQYALNETMLAHDTENRTALMQQCGVDYLVRSRYTCGNEILHDPQLEIVFSNRDITIYAISQSYQCNKS